MSIETYYFSARTCNANVDELMSYLQRYTSDLGYSVTKTAIVDDNDNVVSQSVKIYDKTNGVSDDTPLLNIRLGYEGYTGSSSIDNFKYNIWLGYSSDSVAPTVRVKTVDADKLKGIYADKAYKASNGLMVIFNVVDKPYMHYSICIAKNTKNRLSATMIGPVDVAYYDGTSSANYDSSEEPIFIGDSKYGGIQSIIPMATQDNPTSINYSFFTKRTSVLSSYSKRANRTVLVPLLSKADVYSPYIFLRFFSETPGSIGIMECDGVKYATDGLFALKE
jgi:hypothetical protein